MNVGEYGLVKARKFIVCIKMVLGSMFFYFLCNHSFMRGAELKKRKKLLGFFSSRLSLKEMHIIFWYRFYFYMNNN